uniref:Uncharacterized protein n=1 Tax=Leersia perrieri TaxID=77586 RepID=A0A0D9VZW0_9ORYZ
MLTESEEEDFWEGDWVPPVREEVFAVKKGVEVVRRSGESIGRPGLKMVKHKSVRYSIGICHDDLGPLMW